MVNVIYYLLYVDSTERAYLINSRLAVKDTGMNIRGYAHSLFDGEVMNPETPQSAKDILLFDVYFVKGVSVMHYPLVHLPERAKVESEGKEKIKNPSRIREIETFLKAPAVSYPYRRSLKQFWWPSNLKRIYESVQDAFSKEAAKNVDYEVDGVIFTPMYLPVGVDFTQENREQLMMKKPKLGGTWRSVLKWKPPSQNTIDFLIQEVPYPMLYDDGKNYKKFALFCGKESTPYENSFTFLKNANLNSNAFTPKPYVKKLFDAPFLVEGKQDLSVDVSHFYVELDENGNARAENKDIVQNDTIVELYFDLKTRRWRAQRVRHDKVEMYKTSGSISNAVNNYKSALSIWETTMNPITKDNVNVTGIEKVKKGEVQLDEPYYMRSENRRDEALTYPLKVFHNQWVKEESLISKLKNRVMTLMDPVVGQGGDLPRYINARIPVVLGTDISEGNIYKEGGANDRLMTAMRRGQILSHWRYVFVPMDFSKSIPKILDKLPPRDGENDSTLLKLLWGR